MSGPGERSIARCASSRLIRGEALAEVRKLPTRSVDLILADPPYGTTAADWDVPLDFGALWPELWRVLKPHGAVLLFCQMPFAARLAATQIRFLKYEWIWEKPMATGFLNARRFPMKAHENVLCFARDLHRYFPQMGKGRPFQSKTSGYSELYGKFSIARKANTGTRFPRSVIRFAHEPVRSHPTEKPTALLEYLIRTYTHSGAMVLDFCAGSGSTGVAAMRCGRGSVLIERESRFCRIARSRLRAAARSS